MSDSKNPGTPMPQEAFRSGPLSEEDKFFAEQEAETLENLKAERAKRFETERHCIRPECEKAIMERVEVDRVEIDRCNTCGGVWLDNGELDLLIKRAKIGGSPFKKFFANLAGNYDV